jgi:Holliday junction DNA helicase RuvB
MGEFMEGFNQFNKDVKKTDIAVQDKIRPLSFNDYIGQEELKTHLSVLIESAKIRKKALAHSLLYGQPGLGKTTLATIIANELEKNIVYTSAPAIEKNADLARLLLSLKDGDILFIDEIHGLRPQTEEMLYPAMEDMLIDITIPAANGRENNVVRLPLNNFTLIGATTRPGKLSAPLRDRFNIQLQLKYYDIDELVKIIKRTAGILNLTIDDEAAHEIAKRSRGTARIANNYLSVAGDYAIVKNDCHIKLDIAETAMQVLKIDDIGLNQLDRKIIFAMFTLYKNKPAGVKSIATSIQEEVDTLENMVEPYLLQKNLIMKTERGRVLTDLGVEYAEKLVADGFTLE